MNRRDASTTSCWRHPSQRGAGAGVCADCLKERLSALSPTTPPHRSSFGGASASASSSSAAHHQALVKQSGSNPHHVLSPLVSDAYLRRSKSCSAAGGSSTLLSRHPNRAPGEVAPSNVFGGGRKSDAVLDDWTRQRFFSILAKDQKLSSSSNFRGTTPFRERLRQASNNATINKTVVDPVSTITSSLSSRTVLLENASSSSTRNRRPEPDNGASTGSTKKARNWLSLLLNFRFRSKTTRKEVSEDHEQGSRQDKVDLIKQRSSIRNRFKQPELWPLSPLRLFSQAKKQSKAKSVAAAAVQDMSSSGGEDHPQLQRSSWSTPPSSSWDTKKQSYTTAYYRDYGGWSLSSSPVPNGKPCAAVAAASAARGGSNSKQSSSSIASSSPYHRAAAAAAAASASPSTWNFYLTPLRLAKATTSSSSKHRY